MKVHAVFCLAGLLGMADPVAAQPVATIDQSTPMLRWGTPVILSNVNDLNSRDTQLGQRIEFAVADDVRVDGRIVIPKGTRALGEVASNTRPGMWGKSGQMKIRLLYLPVGDRLVRISGDSSSHGHAGTVGVATAVLAFGWVAGFFVTGTSAKVPAGIPLLAYVDEDVPLRFGRRPAAPTGEIALITD